MFTEMIKRISRKSRQAGFTVAEATIVISAAAILAGSATPVISGYVETARLARAKSDLQVLGSAIQMYRLDTAAYGFTQKGKVHAGKKDQSASVRIMVSNGDIPQVGPGGEPEWIAPFDGQAIDNFQDHLITNTPGYVTSNGRTTGFAQPSQGGFNAPFAWRGPYINAPIDADPWGNRYAANVIYLAPATAEDVVVLSAGADSLVNSPFTKDGLVSGGDDLVFIVSAGR